MEDRFKAFTILVSKITRCVRKIKTEEVAEYNLKSPHVSCLYYLFKQDEMTAKELCDVCDEDKASVSRSIEFLENNGFIMCKSKFEKRYKSPLSLTEKGKYIAEKITTKIDSILSEVGKGLTDENRKILYSSLNLISSNLQKFCEKY